MTDGIQMQARLLQRFSQEGKPPLLFFYTKRKKKIFFLSLRCSSQQTHRLPSSAFSQGCAILPKMISIWCQVNPGLNWYRGTNCGTFWLKKQKQKNLIYFYVRGTIFSLFHFFLCRHRRSVSLWRRVSTLSSHVTTTGLSRGGGGGAKCAVQDVNGVVFAWMYLLLIKQGQAGKYWTLGRKLVSVWYQYQQWYHYYQYLDQSVHRCSLRKAW